MRDWALVAAGIISINCPHVIVRFSEAKKNAETHRSDTGYFLAMRHFSHTDGV